MTTSQQSLSTLGVAAAGAAVVATALYARPARKKKSQPVLTKEEIAVASRTKWEAETWKDHQGEHGPLREIWPNVLYVLEAAGCDRGPPVRNMCIYRIPDGSKRLVIYNAIAVDELTIMKIEELGKPTVLVVPNYYHRCCAAVWKKKYPSLLVVCPAVARDNASQAVVVDKTIEEWAAMPDWSKWIQAKKIDGWADFENVIEVQLEASAKGKKAILVCDLLFTVPYKDDAGYGERFMVWLFDSSIALPPEGDIIVPKVARISRIFAIEDWKKAENWYRTYGREHGKSVAVIVVGHGPPVVEIDKLEGCSKAFEGVAEQLTKPCW